MTDTAPLLLPDGRRVQLSGDARDLSVFASLVASEGVWEPHVVELFRRMVRHDWTCLDVGANLGAHTLALATLAPGGRVIAFEAGRVNAEHLRRNVDAIAAGARVDVERLALWDERGMLHLAMIDQLAGCAFLSERGPAQDEALIRAVVTGENVRQTALDVRSDPVPAVRLDDWVAASGVTRVDLIKIDVEGAETRVLAGGAEVLRRYRPVLVTEYNPTCAVTYWGQAPDAYYRLLVELFDEISVIQPDGSLLPVAGWDALEKRLASGRGWEDLCCISVESRSSSALRHARGRVRALSRR